MIDNISINFNEDALRVLNICIAFVMFGVALDLTLNDFKRLLQFPRKSITGLISQLILLPALTFLVVWLMKPAYPLALGMILVAACPGGNVSNFICHMAKGNAALSVTLTAITTLLAIVLTPFNYGLYSGLLPYDEVQQVNITLSPVDMFETIFLIILIPLILGMLANKVFPEVVNKARKGIKVISIIILISFIAIAFANNAGLFVAYFNRVMWLVLIHNGLALISGYFFAKYLMRLEEADSRTVSLETGIQNSALGLVLIFNFFGGSGGMALIAAWWGIWHIISGFALAWYWSRKSTKTA